MSPRRLVSVLIWITIAIFLWALRSNHLQWRGDESYRMSQHAQKCNGHNRVQGCPQCSNVTQTETSNTHKACRSNPNTLQPEVLVTRKAQRFPNMPQPPMCHNMPPSKSQLPSWPAAVSQYAAVVAPINFKARCSVPICRRQKPQSPARPTTVSQYFPQPEHQQDQA